jgi:hypothetical protein
MNTKFIFGIAIATILILGAIFWIQNSKTNQIQTLETSGDLVSATGIHWHPELKITIKGEEVKVPANIGIGMQYAGYPRYDPMMKMTDMHTHDDSGTLHWEVMKGPVIKEDVRLGSFFAIWGKKFDGSCILEYCNGSGGAVKMSVNGQLNTDFQDYLVNDGDKIEIRYE